MRIAITAQASFDEALFLQSTFSRNNPTLPSAVVLSGYNTSLLFFFYKRPCQSIFILVRPNHRSSLPCIIMVGFEYWTFKSFSSVQFGEIVD